MSGVKKATAAARKKAKTHAEAAAVPDAISVDGSTARAPARKRQQGGGPANMASTDLAAIMERSVSGRSSTPGGASSDDDEDEHASSPGHFNAAELTKLRGLLKQGIRSPQSLQGQFRGKTMDALDNALTRIATVQKTLREGM